MITRKINLKVVHAPTIGVVLDAPPVLVASEHSVDYTCRCGTVLGVDRVEQRLHAIGCHPQLIERQRDRLQLET